MRSGTAWPESRGVSEAGAPHRENRSVGEHGQGVRRALGRRERKAESLPECLNAPLAKDW